MRNRCDTCKWLASYKGKPVCENYIVQFIMYLDLRPHLKGLGGCQHHANNVGLEGKLKGLDPTLQGMPAKRFVLRVEAQRRKLKEARKESMKARMACQATLQRTAVHIIKEAATQQKLKDKSQEGTQLCLL